MSGRAFRCSYTEIQIVLDVCKESDNFKDISKKVFTLRMVYREHSTLSSGFHMHLVYDLFSLKISL